MKTKYDPNYFSINFERLMKTRKLTQSDVSRLTGLTTGSISQLMWGTRGPGLKTLCRILNKLDVSFDEIMEVRDEA